MAGGSSLSIKEKRRREAKERTRQAQSKLEESKKENQKLKSQLDDLAKSQGKNEEKKNEYKRMKALFDGSGTTLEQLEAEALQAKGAEDQEMTDLPEDPKARIEEEIRLTEDLLKEKESLKKQLVEQSEVLLRMPDKHGEAYKIEKQRINNKMYLVDTDLGFLPVQLEQLKEELEDLGLFVPPGPPADPLATAEDPKDAGLFTPADAREATGRTDDGEVRAWREQGNSTPVIIGFGPPNARRYKRSTAFQAGIAFDKDSTP